MTVSCADDHGMDGVGLKVTAVVVVPVLSGVPYWSYVVRPVMPTPPGFPPFGPRGFPLPVADRVHSTTHRNALAHGRLRPRVHGHGHAVFRRHPKVMLCQSSHHRTAPSKNPRSKITLYSRAKPARFVRAGVTSARI